MSRYDPYLAAVQRRPRCIGCEDYVFPIFAPCSIHFPETRLGNLLRCGIFLNVYRIKMIQMRKNELLTSWRYGNILGTLCIIRIFMNGEALLPGCLTDRKNGR